METGLQYFLNLSNLIGLKKNFEIVIILYFESWRVLTNDKMENLFNENIIFIFFFAMIAIYNYSDLKEYQRMTIIYISVYALTILNLIGVKLAVLLLLISLFCFFEIFTSDEMKFKILINPLYKLVDFIYISFSQYAFGGMCCALLMLRIKLPESLNEQNVVFKVLSLLLFIWTLTATLQQKFVIHTFEEMYKIFTCFPINEIEFNEKLDEACAILVSIEDKMYFERKAYSFVSVKYIIRILKNKISAQRGSKKIVCVFSTGKCFIRNVFNKSRGYSTIPMQLVRSIGIKRGDTYDYRRKIFQILYSRMLFQGIERMMKEERVSRRRHFKKYLLYIYFHKVNTFLGDVRFSKFLNAFDMKYDKKNDKDIYDCTNEGIFIACMGLSKRAVNITRENIDYYLQSIDNVELDSDIICDMVEKMMDRPYEGNYLK